MRFRQSVLHHHTALTIPLICRLCLLLLLLAVGGCIGLSAQTSPLATDSAQLLSSVTSVADPPDSLHSPTTYCPATDSIRHVKPYHFIVPSLLVGGSSLFVRGRWGPSRRNLVHQRLSARGEHKLPLDDYTQYAPALAVYGLNLCGVRGRHNFKDRTYLLAISYATMAIVVNTLKYCVKELRPDGSRRNSFPSGHTATAFMGAEFLYQEYKDVSPWIGYTGYALATTTGYLRIYNHRHYFNDVVAGACIGVMSTKLAYWLYPRLCRPSRRRKQNAQLIGLPYYSPEGWGVSVAATF